MRIKPNEVLQAKPTVQNPLSWNETRPSTEPLKTVPNRSNLEIKKLQDGMKFNIYTKISEQQKMDDQQASAMVIKEDQATLVLKSDIVT